MFLISVRYLGRSFKEIFCSFHRFPATTITTIILTFSDAAGEKPIPRPMKRRRRITEVTQRKTRKDEKRRMTDPVNYSVYRENLSNASFDNVSSMF